MKQIHLKLTLMFLYLITNILSEYTVNQDGETCNNAPLEPDSESDCTSYNTEDTACCFATIVKQDRSTENRCIPVQKDARFALNHLTIFSFKDKNNYEFKDIIADFKCGQKKEFCGMDSPNKIFQCSEHSSTTRSCCYLTTPTYTECILSSEKYNKETKFNLFESSTVVCNYKKNQKILYILLFYFNIFNNTILNYRNNHCFWIYYI